MLAEFVKGGKKEGFRFYVAGHGRASLSGVSSRFNTKMTDLVRCTDIDAAELMYYSHFVIERDTLFKKKELHSS